uniref:Uncharacterized protein n=1 Tax=Timema douglasi TaxID=61478 RepID=A0A7R8Z9P9_TIMDO|nr:unnamed protein product [Timema douglasi]
MQALPPGWKPWKLRCEEDSKTSAKEDLKSYEEPAEPPTEPASKTMDIIRPGSAIRKEFGKNPPSGFGPRVDLGGGGLSRSEPVVKKEIPSPTARIDIDKMDMTSLVRQDSSSSRREKLLSSQEKHPRGMTGKGELTLTGGGSMFLKSKQKSELPSPNQSSTSPTVDREPSIEVVSSQSDLMPKSILRDQRNTAPRQLWDVDPREMTSEEKQQWKRQELEEERKSVRFNLEKDLDIKFNVSESSDSDQEGEEEAEINEKDDEDWNSEEEDPDEERVIAGVKVTESQENQDVSSKIYSSEKESSGQIEADAVVSRQRQEMELIERKTEEALQRHKERLEMELEDTIKLLVKDNEKRVSEIRSKMSEDEESERLKLLSQLEERMVLFESGLQTQREVQEKAIRDKMETYIKELEEKLSLECESKCRSLQEDYMSRYKAESSKLEAQLRTEKFRLEDDMRDRLTTYERQLLLKEETQKQEVLRREEETLREIHAVEMDQVLNAERMKLDERARVKMEELRAELRLREEEQLSTLISELQTEKEERLTQFRKEIVQRDQSELEQLRAQLADEINQKKRQLLEAHQQELESLEERLKESLEAERRVKSSALQETLRMEVEQDLEEQKQAMIREHMVLLSDLKEEQLVHLEKLRIELNKEEEAVRKEHTDQLADLRARLTKELDVEKVRMKVASEGLDEAARQELVENSRVFEKVRCEKRLLEDKYRSLKEKYIRLKTDVKISIERRKRRDGGTTTGSETERSSSHKTGGKPVDPERIISDTARNNCSLNDNEKQRTRKCTPTGEAVVIDNNNLANSTSSQCGNTALASKNLQGQLSPEEPDDSIEAGGPLSHPGVDSDNLSSASSKLQVKPSKQTAPMDGHTTIRRRRHLFGRLKASSTLRLNNSNNNMANESSDGEVNGPTALSPVENLRRQLQKLEDLEDQFPASTHTDTYLRYPFTDTGELNTSGLCSSFHTSTHTDTYLHYPFTDTGELNTSGLCSSFHTSTHTDTYLRYPFTDTGHLGSSELEFFRHRIHLERDSVRRAKDFLRTQRNSFVSRQRELKQRQLNGSTTARNMLDQLYQEERELTDMEVSLHRTRSLLGEKIIRLRHLEQSLYRATDSEAPRGAEDQTISDLSSHSGSSGFSSTELGTDTPNLGRVPLGRGTHYQESTEIIQSLENLNSEIREIWEVLHKQQKDASSLHRTAIPPPPLLYQDVAWPTLLVAPTLPERVQALRQQAQQNLSAMAHYTMPGAQQHSSDAALAERTRSLREWLRQARLDSGDLVSPGQATL